MKKVYVCAPLGGNVEENLKKVKTYDKLLSRYKVGLKYLGIIHEQTKAVCGNFLSEQLAEHIREQLGRHNADAEYRPTSVITKMDTPELTRDICSKSLHPNTRRLSSERQAVGEPPQANAQFSYNKAYAERHYRAA